MVTLRCMTFVCIKIKRFTMKLQLLRNATLVLTVNNKTILIDPFLGKKGSYDSLPNCASTERNPLVDLPISDIELEQLISNTDAVLLTHIHNDHWDATAQSMLNKSVTLFCQPANTEAIRNTGFTNVLPVDDEFTWQGITINRTGGHHGTGEIGEMMGAVSGFVIKDTNETLYIAGDTIWCEEVELALDKYKPTHIVVNASAARFVNSDPVLMTAADLENVCNKAPQAKVYVVHLEAVNISTESRVETNAVITNADLSDRCIVPNDGDRLF